MSETAPARRESAVPPLWALPLAIMLVASVLLGLLPFYLRSERLKNDAWTKYVTTRLREVPKQQPSSAIVAVGSSIMRYALRSRVIADRRGRRFQVVRISRANTGWDPLPMLEETIRAKPRVVLIEANLLFFRQGMEQFLAFPWAPRQWLYGKEENFEWFFRTEEQHFEDQPKSDRDLRQQVEEMRRRTSQPDEAEWTRVLQLARNSKTAVVLVDLIPRRADWPVLRSTELARIEEKLARLAKETGALVWRCPMEDRDYSGVGHLHPAGSKKFEKCLGRRLAELPAP